MNFFKLKPRWASGSSVGFSIVTANGIGWPANRLAHLHSSTMKKSLQNWKSRAQMRRGRSVGHRLERTKKVTKHSQLEILRLGAIMLGGTLYYIGNDSYVDHWSRWLRKLRNGWSIDEPTWLSCKDLRVRGVWWVATFSRIISWLGWWTTLCCWQRLKGLLSLTSSAK